MATFPVMIKCPDTQKTLSTGMTMDPESFKTAQMINNSVGCPHCKKNHVWNKADAFLQTGH